MIAGGASNGKRELNFLRAFVARRFYFAGMTIWIIALVLLLSFAGTGYSAGAIRSGISLLGIFLAAVLCIPMGGLVSFIFPMFGYTHPLVPSIFGPVVVFLVIEIIFRFIGSFAHRKVEHHYKYGNDDATAVLWDRMNRRVGLGLGLVHATVYVFLICLFVSVVGYLLIQTGGDKNPSLIYRFMASAADDLKTTKMDKVVAAYNPAPEKYFEISDLLGLLYHNRLLQSRVESYPPFTAMSDQPVYKAIGADTALQEKLQGEVNVFEILEHPKIQELITNSTYSDKLLETDLKDFRTYLETGRSPKYEAEKILGNWSFNAGDTIKLALQKDPDLTASLWVRTKNELGDRYSDAVFTAWSDQRAFLALTTDGRTSPKGPRTNSPPRWVNTNASFSAKGTWKKSAGGDYQVSLKNKNGTGESSDAALQAGKLVFTFENRKVVFDKLAQP